MTRKQALVIATEIVRIFPEFEEKEESIASNRIDCIIAKAYHLSRSEAARYLIEEKVFINGRCITNCNASCNFLAVTKGAVG